MEIQHTDNQAKGSFYIDELAEMTYVWAGNKIIIDHTEVSALLKGKNVGKQLVNKAVEFAREKGIKIMPLCPFAKSVFEKTPEYADVLF